jgi:hypothetical protein
MTAAWERRTLITAAFVVLFMAWQLLVPAAMLFTQRPARFGWQMYSALPDLPRAWLLDAAGQETSVEVSSLFAENRAEIDYAAALRAGLCDLPGTAAVKLWEADKPSPELIECP